MKVILHVGAPKTGTTSLQQVLKGDAARLQNFGVLAAIDKVGSSAPFIAAQRWTKRPHAVREGINSQSLRKLGANYWSTLESRVKKTRPAVTVISSEGFFSLSRERKRNLTKKLATIFSEILVVAYVRPPISLYPSKIDQAVRGGARFSDLTLPSAMRFHPVSNLNEFGDLIGYENLIVRNFSPTNLQGADIVTDFYPLLSQAAGIEVTFPEDSRVWNSGLVGAADLWLLGLNETLHAAGVANEMQTKKTLQQTISLLRDADTLKCFPKLSVNDQRIESAILAGSQQNSSEINSRYLVGQELFPTATLDVEAETNPDFERQSLADWLFSFFDPDAVEEIMRLVSRVAIPTSR